MLSKSLVKSPKSRSRPADGGGSDTSSSERSPAARRRGRRGRRPRRVGPNFGRDALIIALGRPRPPKVRSENKKDAPRPPLTAARRGAGRGAGGGGRDGRAGIIVSSEKRQRESRILSNNHWPGAAGGRPAHRPAPTSAAPIKPYSTFGE
ncbi:hypothetical protein EVAR_82301_1 [Eumeta japonica]|uniref:Uncharacterized protein n=1 Tax=Eumeta variegata TaxID=151549 RepID=A0A4C1W038_EUMVA|nr:hypothetical protein EVAR_82301_1 [Eumeta japonica]